jgi:predicted ATP-grasp superfamily ATP-dependent carboligase
MHHALTPPTAALADRPLVAVVNSLCRTQREYLLRSISGRYRVWLLQDGPPSWELPYLTGHTMVNTLDPQAMLAAVSPLGLSGVLCWDEVRIEAAASLAAALGLPGGDPAAVRRCRDKHLTRTTLAAAGVPQPASTAVDSPAQAAAAARRIGYPVVVKPRALSGSYGVTLVSDPDELAAAFEQASSRTIDGVPTFHHNGVLVEEYLTGQEISIDCVLHHGTTTPITLARKQLGYPPHFEEIGHTVNPTDPLLHDPTVLNILHAAHHAVGLRDGWAHTELRLTPTGPKVIEINARLGGDLIPYLGQLATGTEPGLLAAAAACGQRPAPEPTHRRVAGVAFGYPTRRCKAAGMRVDDELLPEGVDRIEFLTAPGTWIEPPPAGHVWGRYCYIVAVADTVAQCQDRLESAAKAVTLLVDGER